MRVPHPNYPDGLAYVKRMGVSLEEMCVDDLVITDVPTGASSTASAPPPSATR